MKTRRLPTSSLTCSAFVFFAVWAFLAAAPAAARAQTGTSFYYYNPRTGMSYSQAVGVGPGSAYGGFTYSRGGRTYSAGSGYRGRRYYSGMSYANPNFGYGQRTWFGR